MTLRQGRPFKYTEFTLFHEGRHTEADIDRRVDERKETKNQVATTFYMHIYIIYIYI